MPQPWERGRGAALWRRAFLLFVAYPLIVLFAVQADALEVGLTLAADALFVGLAVAGARWGSDDPRRSSPLMSAANMTLTVLAAALLIRDANGPGLALFYYASTTAALVRPNGRSVNLMILAGLAGALAIFLTYGDLASGLLQGVSIAVIGLVINASFEVRRTNQQLVEARHRLATLAVTEERNRIARDLHDTLGHSLSLIAVKSELATRLLPDEPNRAREEIADVTRAAREALGAVRETVSGYRRPSLGEELEGARTALEAAGIKAEIDAPTVDLPRLADTLLAWTVREATTNVLRHSRARRAWIAIRSDDGTALLEVSDDGQGSEVDAEAGGSGLAGLRERLAAAGGRLERGPRDGGGFRLAASVPTAAVLTES
jgi:two-component system sensor histidine kinase DesK